MKATCFAIFAVAATIGAALPVESVKRLSDPFRITKSFTITSPINATISSSNVVAALQDQASLAHLSPYVFSVQPGNATAADISAEAAYEATRDSSDVPIKVSGQNVPWNTWAMKESVPPGLKVSFHGDFQSVENGLDTIVLAPAGVEFITHWRVIDNGNGNNTLSEVFNVTCDALLMPTVTGNIQNAHTQIQHTLLEMVANGTLQTSS